MYITLKIESLSMNSLWSDKTFKNPAPDTTAIAMQVIPIDRDYIKLSTGEVFRHPRRHFGHDDKPKIAAYVYIYVPKDPARNSTMRYFEGSTSDDGDLSAAIHFDLAVEAAAFNEAIANIRSGIFPTAVTIEFDVSLMNNAGALDYGLLPDGSEIKWDNSTREKRDVRIKSVRFIFDILQPPPAPDSIEAAEATERPILVQSPGAAPNEDSKALLAAVGDINKNLKHLVRVLAVIVATALGVSYKFW